MSILWTTTNLMCFLMLHCTITTSFMSHFVIVPSHQCLSAIWVYSTVVRLVLGECKTTHILYFNLKPLIIHHWPFTHIHFILEYIVSTCQHHIEFTNCIEMLLTSSLRTQVVRWSCVSTWKWSTTSSSNMCITIPIRWGLLNSNVHLPSICDFTQCTGKSAHTCIISPIMMITIINIKTDKYISDVYRQWLIQKSL